ncbi:hypothetical protein DOM21_10415 [Bacteriovorax stolpii]|uniref:Uncharacterized protein n=1 Tax=Bacteriovorax stolpii TaxID=960 RepID=A0A2K9NSV7_BACTC|nr:outer membrane beta-barrel protein [Bacteriovorax stolpii]AUN98165.1 hypothetical protein C0V70_08605 [Bacteriovorax stolpii]QDK41854.1 hypothetical protein DOM21_10415 [Bacteriovorax stolpii]TDP52082.1 hypothetical protein C8D79_2730 [Bacteriovorax stolpii]
MKRSLYFVLPAVFAFNVTNVSALEIDEKLTLRFLKVSSSKKTVLVNRGGEDGLVVGDHAKFFITAGVVARGVAEKVSPSRSVWSLYRIVDPNEITQDKVLNLKIATPVKITDDPSKSLKEEPIPGGTETMNVEDNSADGAASEEIVVSDADKDELKGLGLEEDMSVGTTKSVPSKTASSSKKTSSAPVIEESAPVYSSNTSKTWEAWGTLYVNSLSGTVESDTTTSSSTAASGSTIDFSAGIEKYFLTSSSFFKEFSLSLFAHKRTIETGDDVKSTSDWFEYGVGANYHFYNSAASVNKLIGYGALTAGKGSASVKSVSTTGGVATENTTDGTNTFFSVGVGAKYILNNGFGVRAILDYYHSSEEFEFDDGAGGTFVSTRTLAGPRVQFGLSYRF